MFTSITTKDNTSKKYHYTCLQNIHSLLNKHRMYTGCNIIPILSDNSEPSNWMRKHTLLNLRKEANHLLVLQELHPQGYHQGGLVHNPCTWRACGSSHREHRLHTSWHRTLGRGPGCAADSGCSGVRLLWREIRAVRGRT